MTAASTRLQEAVMIGRYAVLVILVAMPAWAQESAKPDLTSAWAELGAEDETRAAKALLTLGKSPAEAIGFLKEHLRPVKADAKEVSQWIKDLDDANFRVRGR